MTRLANILLCCGPMLVGAVPLGCAARDAVPTDSVGGAWQSPRVTRGERESHGSASQPIRATDDLGGEAVATVNGRDIPLGRLRQLLMRSRGLEVLEQLIGLETVAAAADTAGVTIARADVDREHERSLRQIVDPLSSITTGSIDRDRAEKLLDTVLMRRGVSREEFRLVMRRNAYLRKLVEPGLTFTDDELRAEYNRRYGMRVEVRHIQLTSLGAVDRVLAELAAGKAFGELARRYSANEAGAGRGGMLKAFSASDASVPAAFREVAFSLKPGEVSDPVRLGEWYHLIRLERVLPRQAVDFEQVRSELERTLRDSRSDRAMSEVFDKLSRQASISIRDPSLKSAFDRKRASQR